MLRIHFTPEDLARVRVASRPDPLWEIALSLHRLRTPLGRWAFAEWNRGTRATRYFPDFLTPDDSADGLEQGLAAIVDTPPDRVAHEVRLLARGRTGPARRPLARAAGSVLRDSYAALQGRWFTELTSLRGDPRTVRALRALSGCLAGRGIRARDENAFFALSDARMQTVAPAELPRTERRLGSAYASCMRPVEAVREPARLRLRARFLNVNAA